MEVPHPSYWSQVPDRQKKKNHHNAQYTYSTVADDVAVFLARFFAFAGGITGHSGQTDFTG